MTGPTTTPAAARLILARPIVAVAVTVVAFLIAFRAIRSASDEPGDAASWVTWAMLGYIGLGVATAALFTRITDKRTGERFSGVAALPVRWAYGSGVALVPVIAEMALDAPRWLAPIGLVAGTAVLVGAVLSARAEHAHVS